MEKRTERRTLKHLFSNDELLTLSEEMAVKNQELRQQEDEKKSVMSQYSSHINELKESISSLATKVANKFEHRDVDCEIEYHTPDQDMKTITRKDNGTSWSEPMKEFDYDLFNQFNGDGDSGEENLDDVEISVEKKEEEGTDPGQAEYESRMEDEISKGSTF